MPDTSVNQAEEIVFNARQLHNAAERMAFFRPGLRGDARLRAAVEKISAECAVMESLFADSRPTFARDAEVVRRMAEKTELREGVAAGLDTERIVGTRIGPYKLLQKIGEGGCGVVYMAEQEKPVRRRVALKVIKLGMDTKNVIARFEAERQALALMDHPSIARVLDAGATETGRPYFVMELVRGVKITTYCDEQRLDVRQRLDLFIRICGAVQHAHQKGIVHRDLKPSNILVTILDGAEVPKVIDFGIAKATSGEPLTDHTVFTAYEQFVGTPAYMSPEQAQLSGMDVDTRSDVYSLGVLLYELLTGKTPFDQTELLQSGLDEMRRTLLEREPHRPSTRLDALRADELTHTTLHRQVETPKLKSLLKGDLDWIVMMALEKDRNRRYQTANGFAADIRRYLANEPVLACPPSRWYRLQKLIRRNRTTFAAIAAVSLALVMGLGISTWLFFKEREARKRAVVAEQQALDVGKEQARLRVEAEDHERITQAAYLISQNKIAEADALAGKVLALKPSLEADNVLRTLGMWNALQGRWAQSAERFNLLLQVDQRDNSWAMTDDLLQAGPVLIEEGDRQAYEKFRRAAIARFRDTTDPIFAERTLKISLLMPADEEVLRALRPLSELSADSLREQPVPGDIMSAWRCISLALMAYREGFTPTAKMWCQRSLTFAEDNAARIATAHVICAMACHQLGETEEAREELELGRKQIEAGQGKGMDVGSGSAGWWYDWFFARILLREADGLLK